MDNVFIERVWRSLNRGHLPEGNGPDDAGLYRPVHVKTLRRIAYAADPSQTAAVRGHLDR
jgi:hypothetical protein